ncbi:MAG: lipoyl synthase, partial [Magnetococcales bacterium]|nr:lipoyl synthase [Magnetococcales bacterium]
TSVTRDDLPDGGAEQFVACVAAIRARRGALTSVELLIPDLRGHEAPLLRILASAPEVLNHNIETVPRLYPRVRPAADYAGSLTLLARAAAHGGMRVKSGLMLGLGEEASEILATLRDLREAGVDALTIGQYLSPGPAHLPVERYWPPETFAELKTQALSLGFATVESHPLARSSLHAAGLFSSDC